MMANMYCKGWQIKSWAVLFLLLNLLCACSSPQTQSPSKLQVSPLLTDSSFVADDGYHLPIMAYWPSLPAKAIVVAVHGFNDYSNGFKRMCEYYLANDIACLSYDQRGFGKTKLRGLWPEKGRLQKDLQVIVKLLAQQHPDSAIFLLGESMGGAVILTAMADTKLDLKQHVEGVILYAPAVWARSTQPWYQTFSLWFAVHTFPDWKPTGDGLGIQASDNIEALRAMSRDQFVIKETRIDAIYGLTNLMDAALLAAKDMPVKTLVLYGDQDQVIPKPPTCTILLDMKLSAQDITFKHYPQGYHMLSRDLQAMDVFEDSRVWMIDLPRLNQQQKIQLIDSRKFIELQPDASITYCD